MAALLPSRALGCLAVAVLALGGCNDDGRTLEPTSATMPPSSEVPATSTTGEALGLRVSSPDVADGAALEAAFTCDGEGRAPTLVFSGAPPAAAELAVAIVDLDAADRVHLAVSGLASTTTDLDPLQPPPEAVLARSDGDVLGWEAPCLQREDGTHRFEIRLYAMAEPVGLTSGLPGPDAVALFDGASIDVHRSTFTYAAAG